MVTANDFYRTTSTMLFCYSYIAHKGGVAIKFLALFQDRSEICLTIIVKRMYSCCRFISISRSP